jgi:hypothetical protein
MSIKYIFCINSGRCGSDYLTELLSQARNTVSIHEGTPIMNGEPMQKFNDGDDSELCELLPLKIREIKKKSKNGHKIYCETNHSFIKGWGYLIPDLYIPQEEIGVIILRRDIDKTAYSLLRVHEVPGVSEWSRTWYLTPNIQRNLSKPAKNANLYELCKWYIEETYLRAQEYKQIFPKIRYLECDLEQLNEYDFVVQMFEYFGLVATPELTNAVGNVINKRNEWPRLSLEELMQTPKYPCVDNLTSQERDELVTKIINYLQEHKFDEISQAQPDYAMGGTLIGDLTKIVTYNERELEEVFKYSLMFTETESILIWEFLRTINPNDLLLFACERSPSPGIRYKFNFNGVFSIKIMLQQYGLRGVFIIIWMIMKGVWNRDLSHRQAV